MYHSLPMQAILGDNQVARVDEEFFLIEDSR